MNSLIFLKTFDFFLNLFTLLEIPYLEKKITAITVKLLDQSLGKFSNIIQYLIKKMPPKFVTFHSFVKILKVLKKIEKIHMDSKNE